VVSAEVAAKLTAAYEAIEVSAASMQLRQQRQQQQLSQQ
jgi:hypothetical protein